MRRGSHHRRGSLPRRGFLHTRGSLHEHRGTRAPGISGHIVFLRGGSYAAFVLAGVLCQESVPQSEVYSLHSTSRWSRLAIAEPDTTDSTEELSSTYTRWASLFLRSVVFCSSLDLFQHNCWNHFLLHCGGGFTSSGNIRLQLLL